MDNFNRLSEPWWKKYHTMDGHGAALLHGPDTDGMVVVWASCTAPHTPHNASSICVPVCDAPLPFKRACEPAVTYTTRTP